VSDWGGLILNNSEFEIIAKFIAWEVTPPFSKIGRTAHFCLKQPVTVNAALPLIRSLKIKGVGLRNQAGEISFPTTRPYFRANPHLGILNEGVFSPVPSEPAPLGGISFSYAQREFINAEHLLLAACPCQIPIGLYRYNELDLEFEHNKHNEKEPLAVVVSGLPGHLDVRGDAALNYEAADIQTRKVLDEWAKQMEITLGVNPGLSILTELYSLLGGTLRKFSSSGLYRYSSTPDNISYAAEVGKVFLMDLDSSMSLETCSATAKPLQVMRDTASALFHLAAFLLHPKYINTFQLRHVETARPFHQFLSSYYYDVADDLVEKVADVYEDHYRQTYPNAMKRSDLTVHEKRQDETFQQFWVRSHTQDWIEREKTYILLMMLLWYLFDSSRLSDQYPHTLSFEQFCENMSGYGTKEMVAEAKSKLLSIIPENCLAQYNR